MPTTHVQNHTGRANPQQIINLIRDLVFHLPTCFLGIVSLKGVVTCFSSSASLLNTSSGSLRWLLTEAQMFCHIEYLKMTSFVRVHPVCVFGIVKG